MELVQGQNDKGPFADITGAAGGVNALMVIEVVSVQPNASVTVTVYVPPEVISCFAVLEPADH